MSGETRNQGLGRRAKGCSPQTQGVETVHRSPAALPSAEQPEAMSLSFDPHDLRRSVIEPFPLSVNFGCFRLFTPRERPPASVPLWWVSPIQNRKFPDKNTPGSISGRSASATYNDHFRTSVRFCRRATTVLGSSFVLDSRLSTASVFTVPAFVRHSDPIRPIPTEKNIFLSGRSPSHARPCTILHQIAAPCACKVYHEGFNLCRSLFRPLYRSLDPLSLRLRSLRYLLFTLLKTEQNRTKREGGPEIAFCTSTGYNYQNRTAVRFCITPSSV